MMPQPSFPDLIAPIDPADFLDVHWQRRPLRSTEVPGVRQLVSLADVEYLLSSLSSPDGNWIKVMRVGSAVPASALATQQGHLGLAKIYDAYRAGYTIQLAKLHKRWPAIGRLCREVERSLTQLGVALAGRVGAHLHLTPPTGASRGPHYHTHDNLIVQVAGRKQWSLHAAIDPFPVEPLAGDLSRDQLSSPEQELWLEPGHVLYVPRGMVHHAATQAEHSLHITLDILPYTWMDLFHRVVLDQAALREALPVGAWQQDGPSAQLRQGYQARCDQLGRCAADLAHIAPTMLTRFVHDVDALPSRGLEELHRLDAIGLDTVVRQRPGAFACLIAEGSATTLLFPGSAMRGPEVLGEVLQAIADRTEFVVRDLPGELADQSKIDLVKEFIREGFLEMAEPGAPSPDARSR